MSERCRRGGMEQEGRFRRRKTEGNELRSIYALSRFPSLFFLSLLIPSSPSQHPTLFSHHYSKSHPKPSAYTLLLHTLTSPLPSLLSFVSFRSAVVSSPTTTSMTMESTLWPNQELQSRVKGRRVGVSRLRRSRGIIREFEIGRERGSGKGREREKRR